jgi:uncharacterized membrane protein
MSTNVESWSDVASLGAIYPFPGIEWPLVIIGVLIWLAWHCWQIRSENKEYDDALRHYNEVGLDAALDHRGRHDSMVSHD